MIVPDHQLAHVASRQEHIVYELLRRQHRHRAIEREHHHPIEPRLGYDLEPFLCRGQPCRCGRGIHDI